MAQDDIDYKVYIVSGNGLMPNRQQDINRTNNDQVLLGIHVSPYQAEMY